MTASEKHGRLRIRTMIMVAAGLALAAILALAGLATYISSLIPALVRLNRECQEEGYYMAEFEFKMLAFAYQLDKGRYAEAISGIRQLHERLKSRKDLIKVPKFSGKREEMEFYLARQNLRTGAFMDDSFPYCTYDAPTENVLLHLEALAKETGQPLRLICPLKYLDEINTPEKLTALLDDLSYIGWIASRFPQTSFLFGEFRLSSGYSAGGQPRAPSGFTAFGPIPRLDHLDCGYNSLFLSSFEAPKRGFRRIGPALHHPLETRKSLFSRGSFSPIVRKEDCSRETTCTNSRPNGNTRCSSGFTPSRIRKLDYGARDRGEAGSC